MDLLTAELVAPHVGRDDNTSRARYASDHAGGIHIPMLFKRDLNQGRNKPRLHFTLQTSTLNCMLQPDSH